MASKPNNNNAVRFTKAKSNKQGGMFQYVLIVLIGGWLLASIYFFYSSSASHSASSSSIVQSKFDKLDSFKSVQNINSHTVQNSAHLSHKLNCPDGKVVLFSYLFSLGVNHVHLMVFLKLDFSCVIH
jgi:hypothetical protein